MTDKEQKQKEYLKAYKEANKEKIKEQAKAYYLANKDKIKAKQKEYVQVNKDKIKEQQKNFDRETYNKIYKQTNKDKIKEQQKGYQLANKEKQKIYQKDYRENNKNKLKTYRENNKDKIKSYQKKYVSDRIKIDPLFRMTRSIRANINQSIKKNDFKKLSKTELILGCSFIDLKLHLESKFESWMTWGNYGLYNGEQNYGWDIDHIIPTSKAITESELLKLHHFSNLQPLCSKLNRDIKKANDLTE